MRKDIEVLRILSMFGIVWFHTNPYQWRSVTYAGLVIFLILTPYLSGNHSKPIINRTKRLILPWLIWMIIYAAINLILSKPFSASDSLIITLISGTCFHLWFLPFIFLVHIIFDKAKDNIPATTLSRAAGILAVGVLLTCQIWREPSLTLGYPFAQWAHALIGILIGVFMWGLASPIPLKDKLILMTIIGVTLIMFPVKGVGIPYFIGTVIFTAIIKRNYTDLISLDPTPISKLMFGVYLIHPIIIGLYSAMGIGLADLKPVIVFMISTGVIWLIRKLPMRWTQYVA